MSPISLLDTIIETHVKQDICVWLKEQQRLLQASPSPDLLYKIFSSIPRKTGTLVPLYSSQHEQQVKLTYSLHINGWSIDRLSRVWILTELPSADKKNYLAALSNLYNSASMNELVALYSALPIYHYPNEWQAQCAIGIRSNIALVLDAILYANSYPFAYLEEAAWNQMILKAFFTDKDVGRIIGLDQRANVRLADMLIQYAQERWSARRTVNPQLWRLTGRFLHDGNFASIQRLAMHGSEAERNAAALACRQSDYMPAKLLLNEFGDVKTAIEDKKLSWDNVEEKLVH